jgi:hypothetical protein
MLFHFVTHASVMSLFCLSVVASPAFEETVDLEVTELADPRELMMMRMTGMQPMMVMGSSKKTPTSKPTMKPSKSPTKSPTVQDVCAGKDVCAGNAGFCDPDQKCVCVVDTEGLPACIPGSTPCVNTCSKSSDCGPNEKCIVTPSPCCDGIAPRVCAPACSLGRTTNLPGSQAVGTPPWIFNDRVP